MSVVFVCSCCRNKFNSSPHEDMRLLPRSPKCHSSLFQSNHILCKMCSDNEEVAIQEAGTNDIPRLLKQYKRQ